MKYVYIMILNNILSSGFNFDENEDLLKFKFKMINMILLIISIFSTLFGVLHDLDINDIGYFHSRVDYIYGLLAFLLIFFLRYSKNNYNKTVTYLMLFSLITFTSALINVPQDEFRMIWFYLLIFVAYMLKGSSNGVIVTIASISIIIISNNLLDLHLSQISINSGVLGLVIGSLIARVYTNKISDYENSLDEKNETLKYLACTDGLTGIMNRRSFDEVSTQYFEMAKRNTKHISLLVLDLDNFKIVNDTHGHSTGNQILISFAHTIKGLLRKSDVFARVGGEEFVVLLFDTDDKNAFNLAEKIRVEVENILLEHDHDIVKITTSIGISQNQENDMSFLEIFDRSDKALYQAKSEGRNRVCIL